MIVKKNQNEPTSQQHFLVDTHCHINCMIKKEFDRLLTVNDFPHAASIVDEASKAGVKKIINVGTSLAESINCVELAKSFNQCYAAVGIHPNDCTGQWQQDLKQIESLWFDKRIPKHKNFRIVAIGECGIDRHYPDFNLQRQKDAFKAQIELALEHELPLIVHTRDAGDETLRSLEEYIRNGLKGVIHCFSEDTSFAQTALGYGFVLGIGGTLTYPKNRELREIFQSIPLEKIILETDAPFLPIQSMRGKQNHPKYILDIAQFLAELRNEPFEKIAQLTTQTAMHLFKFIQK
jgi:TatD DNase family protein